MEFTGEEKFFRFAGVVLNDKVVNLNCTERNFQDQ